MSISIRPVKIEDYAGIFALWNSTEQSKRALNPVDDSREGIEKYLKRNPTTCFLAEVQDGIDETFSDIVELERMCKFSNCRHDTEPGCAIKAAIESGELSAERYELYINLGRENTKNYAMKKEISKWAKAYKKIKAREEFI